MIFHILKSNWKKGLFLISLCVPILLKISWLTLFILLCILIYLLTAYLLNKVGNMPLRRALKGVFLFFFVFILSIATKMFIGEIYRIPSNSMMNTLFPEDVILVNKLAYGPRLPRKPSDIYWVNLLFYLNRNSRTIKKKNWWPYRRLRGTNHIKRGDILVFEPDRTFSMVKRCEAIAGDTLSIVQGLVQIKGFEYSEPLTVVNTYDLELENGARFYKYLDSSKFQLHVLKGSKVEDRLRVSLSNKQKSLLKEDRSVATIEKQIDSSKDGKELFTMFNKQQWTLDNMGPFVVPKKGMKIILDRFNFALYEKTFNSHEGLTLEQKPDGYYDTTGKKVSSYTFTKDYFFMIGDNRKNSVDSRYFGFMPEEAITGKVQCVLFSNYNGQFAWNRVLKRVNVLAKNK